MIKHLVWDLHGTLFDTYPAFTNAFLAAVADSGHYAEPEIDDIIAADDGFPKKPDPTGMQAIMIRNGISANEGLAIGDRAIDIAAARAAGLWNCLFGKADDQLRPDYRVDHLDQLLEIIQQENLTSGS